MFRLLIFTVIATSAAMAEETNTFLTEPFDVPAAAVAAVFSTCTGESTKPNFTWRCTSRPACAFILKKSERDALLPVHITPQDLVVSNYCQAPNQELIRTSKNGRESTAGSVIRINFATTSKIAYAICSYWSSWDGSAYPITAEDMRKIFGARFNPESLSGKQAENCANSREVMFR